MTEQVGRLKAECALGPEDVEREQQRTRYHAFAERFGAPADVITDVMVRVWDHVKSRHERLRLR